MVRFLIGIILAICILVVGGLVFFESQKNIKERARQAQVTPTSIPTPTKIKIEIPKDFVLFKSDIYSLYHPQKMMVRDEGNGINAFVLIGPSQKGQTEMYDGINFTVLTGNYETNDFREFVDSEVKKMQSEGTIRVEQGILSVSIGENDGYEFMSRSLGEFRNIYFDAGNKKFVHVVILLEDPTKQGFDKIVDQMLQTLSF